VKDLIETQDIEDLIQAECDRDFAADGLAFLATKEQ